jgi:hypothetical protein
VGLARLPIAQLANGNVVRFAAHDGESDGCPSQIRKWPPAAYICAMRKSKRETECEWRVIRLRSKGHYLGTVKAVDHDAAVKVALKQFGIDKSEADRLLIRRCRASAHAVETKEAAN